jgi:hypothetical protein
VAVYDAERPSHNFAVVHRPMLHRRRVKARFLEDCYLEDRCPVSPSPRHDPVHLPTHILLNSGIAQIPPYWPHMAFYIFGLIVFSRTPRQPYGGDLYLFKYKIARLHEFAVGDRFSYPVQV